MHPSFWKLHIFMIYEYISVAAYKLLALIFRLPAEIPKLIKW